MSEKRDLQHDKRFLAELAELGAETIAEAIANHAIDRAVAAEREVARLIVWHNREIQINIAEKKEIEQERDALILALRDGFADDVQHPTKADLLYWITATCPWVEFKFDES